MGLEGNSATTSPSPSSPSASVKRGRDPEDEVYVDNLHSHKRYLSEIMASSLNGLTVGDTLSENLMDSPVRSESMMPSLRDELSVQYSPMSEDSDDSRYYESSINTCPSQPESAPTSPVSPHRGQKPLSTYIATSPVTSYHCNNNNNSSAMSQQPRQRGSDTEGRFPSSPSDICHSSDLRKTALLRSVQMRAQPLGSSALSPGREPGNNNIEGEEPTCSYMKLDGDERGYRVGECAPLSLSDGEDRDKGCRTLRMKLKEDDESSTGE
ncbi:hypothetical protein PHJA_002389200 [Phtheirospermum japonicum]|uniref:Uncharacterized protein n=1 Tax=Phtheirospermum japonicum TaxID=374723 RepID=A0A830CVZ7_9LAMI|nr:hypothetical protein PHJA_002389200 [Phtheirospermum japonicum]